MRSRKRVTFATLIVMALLLPSLSGCFGGKDTPAPPPSGPFDFDEDIPVNTFYHYPGGISVFNQSALDAGNITQNLTGNNTPIWANGTYYGIGYSTFEPTIGITSSGTIVMTNYRGSGDGTHIIRSQDQGMTWDDIGPFNPVFPIGQVPNSNDPYLYVDPWTDRIVKFDMHALTAMFFEYSDNDGESWSIPFSAYGYYSPQDHQSIASMPVPEGVTAFHEVIYVFCINTGSSALGPQCSRSLDGGHEWDLQRPGYPIGTPQCSGLHGHLAGSPDGTIMRGNPSCDGPAVYRSEDGGYSWTEHTISTTIGMQEGWHDHEVAVAADAEGNIFAMWISNGQKPYVAYSRDKGETWSEPWMVAAPGVNETGFPTIFAGDEGRVAFGYIGEGDDFGGWSGYMGVVTDAFSEHPLITTVAVNDPNDPLDISDDCGDVRCGGFGDFIDIEIDDDGRPWIALAHNVEGGMGIAGTYITGPSLIGDVAQLPELPVGGNSTLVWVS